MSSPTPPPSPLTLILWTVPEAYRTFCAIARQAGCRQIVKVEDDTSFTEAAAAADPGVALIDEHGCGFDPLHLIARAVYGELGQRLPAFILMASKPTRTLVETALSAGFGSVIAKPFSAQTLAAHIARAVAVGSPPLLRDNRMYVD